MNKPFDQIVHRNDDKGVYCNSHIGKMTTVDKEVTCRKCRKLIDDPKRLERRRNPKVSEEVKDTSHLPYTTDHGVGKAIRTESADEEGLK